MFVTRSKYSNSPSTPTPHSHASSRRHSAERASRRGTPTGPSAPNSTTQQQYVAYSSSHRRPSTPQQHQQLHQPNSRSKMSASTSTSSSGPYLLVPNLHVPDATWPEVDLAAQQWVMATVIEDDDLTFGGKPLSAWYEEERTRQSMGSTASSHSSHSAGSSEGEYTDEEELRGRQRVRSHHRGGKEKKSGRKH